MRRFKHIVFNTLALALLGYLPALAQLQPTVDAVKKVAGYIVKNTTYTFVDAKNKARYTSTQGLAADAAIKTESIYNKWEYANGVMAIGMMELSKTFDDTTYHNYVGRNFKFVFDNIAYFSQQYAANPKTEFYNLIRMNRLDDMGALSAALTLYNQSAKVNAYTAYLQKSITYLSNGQTRLPDGTLCRKEPREMTIWADDLYMSVPFLAAYSKASNQAKYTNDAIAQVMNFTKYLYDANTGLYYHNWYSHEKGNGVAHWLRCNGWIAMAQVALLQQLDANHPKRKELIALLQRQIIGFARYQDVTGLWHQVIDRPDSYLETSGSAMFIYAVAKAVNEGWIPKTYLPIAEDGWQGMLKKITPDGEVQDVCIGTGMRENIKFYYERPVKLNDFHVAGAVLLAGSEMIKVYRKQKS